MLSFFYIKIKYVITLCKIIINQICYKTNLLSGRRVYPDSIYKSFNSKKGIFAYKLILIFLFSEISFSFLTALSNNFITNS